MMFGLGPPLKDPKLAWEDTDLVNGSPLALADLQTRVATYNRFHEGTHLQLKTTQEKSMLQFEGQLRIYWGVKTPIHFQKLDETSINREARGRDWRRSLCGPAGRAISVSMSNGVDDLLKNVDSPVEISTETDMTRSQELETISAEGADDNSQHFRYNTIGGSSGVNMRRKKVSRKTRRRLSMINGHLYDLETSVFTPMEGSVTSVHVASTDPATSTSVFTPMEGSVTSVHVTSTDPATSVISLLLHKFKVENNPDEFCLCCVKRSGEVRVLSDSDCPLMRRVLMGPLEEEGKIWLRDRSKVKPISDQVAQYLGLPEPMLIQFLQKLEEDELIEKQHIIYKYEVVRAAIERTLQGLRFPKDSYAQGKEKSPKLRIRDTIKVSSVSSA